MVVAAWDCVIRTGRGAGCRWCWRGWCLSPCYCGAARLLIASHATILAVAAVAVAIGVAGRYVVGLWTLPALLVGTSVIVAVPVAGLVAAVVVPTRFYTPPFRKAVEWIEYVCLTGIFPLAFWLMGVLAAIRYR